MSLSIYNCQELEQIVAANEELVLLPTAEVERCNELKSLFLVTMIKMLPQLSTLHIFNCNQIEDITLFEITNLNRKVTNRRTIIVVFRPSHPLHISDII
ncbi:putative leucine-rich repeat domain, L domain-containing protein [Medicago truncatula]|uniref:Putative leucine-rich repeat domain, L domain-containing protein n=1 Tax=Medicago truncatula TaxID=3880 RepID=G7J038_MEDTR|nr:hypothetical protein MTR_3g055220 [Medicago truncatula]RHN67208.1 putative leucine-rich repeat domain, L domain-containing protein [Medicago truncatula]